jgi:hypothetical protein
LFFHDDQAGIHQLLASIPDFARQYQLGYVLLTRGDFYRDLHDSGAHQLCDAVESNRVFEAQFKSPTVTVYRMHDPGAAQASLRPGL